MSQDPGMQIREGLPGEGSLGVMDATRMGWRLMMSDFWPIWVVGLVAFAIQAGLGIVGALPYIGVCIALAVGIFVQPPLNAGLFYAIRRRIDEAPARVGDLFEGFRQRYWQSVVAILLPMAIGLVGGLAIVGIIFAAIAIAEEAGGDEEVPIALGTAMVIVVPLAIILGLIGLLFLFSLLAVWDHPESGWEAVKDSVRVVRAHYRSCIGFGLLFALIGLGAYLAGVIACCVGVFFTMPLFLVWFNAAAIYLYRSWTGQALVQPVAGAPPVPEGTSAGPIPPSDIQPPAGV